MNIHLLAKHGKVIVSESVKKGSHLQSAMVPHVSFNTRRRHTVGFNQNLANVVRDPVSVVGPLALFAIQLENVNCSILVTQKL